MVDVTSRMEDAAGVEVPIPVLPLGGNVFCATEVLMQAMNIRMKGGRVKCFFIALFYEIKISGVKIKFLKNNCMGPMNGWWLHILNSLLRIKFAAGKHSVSK